MLDSDEDDLLGELRVKGESIFLKRPNAADDFDAGLNFDPS
jgi:hypothetical protein